MDLTNRYIIMCQKAEDIQHAWMPRQCDFIIEQEVVEQGLSSCKQGAGEVQVVDLYYQDQESEGYRQECEDLKNNAFWLPRQDQLQNIMEPDIAKVSFLVNEVLSKPYYYPLKNVLVEPASVFYSLEQLWLAYVIKEKFNKAWNEEEWVSGNATPGSSSAE